MNDKPDPRILGYKRIVSPAHLQAAREAAMASARAEELGAFLCEYPDGDRIVLRFEHGRRTFVKPNIHVTVPDYCTG